MKKLALFSFLLILFCTCQRDVTSDDSFFTSVDESERFSIDYTRYTTLRTENGTTLTIPAGTFSIHEGGLVEIEVKEVRTKAQMIRQRMSTMTVDGKILETGGMIYVGVEPNQTFNGPIRISMPTEGVKPQMAKFIGTQNEEDVTV